MSVPSTADVQATFAATLVDEWVRHGVRDAVLCPGSRSTPLALAVAARPEITVHVRLDERSAGYFALGCTLRTDAPTLVVVTSGTAAAELHPAVAEASHAGVPLIVATADRPPELHGVGAPQTMRQRELFGPLVRRYEEPGVARSEAASAWRPMAARLVHASRTPRPGPVHLNAAFAEPLVGVAGDLPPGRRDGVPWQLADLPEPVEVAAIPGRVLVVAGLGAEPAVMAAAAERDWPVLGDATCAVALPYADALVRIPAVVRALAPSVVVRTGGLPASKALAAAIGAWDAPVVTFDRTTVADPEGWISERRTNARPWPTEGERSVDYLGRWEELSKVAGSVAATLDDDGAALSEPAVARAVVRSSQDHAVPLVVGSSMPVRDVEWWTERRGARVLANRGLNGIDGVTSTACGVAAAGAAIAYVGDLTFLHDVSGLVEGVGDHGGRLVMVVVENGGGGIFSFLPQATAVGPDDFARLFTTRRPHDVTAIARAFGHEAATAKTAGELEREIDAALRRDGVTVIAVPVPDVGRNVVVHDDLNAAVAAAVADRLT